MADDQRPRRRPLRALLLFAAVALGSLFVQQVFADQVADASAWTRLQLGLDGGYDGSIWPAMVRVGIPLVACAGLLIVAALLLAGDPKCIRSKELVGAAVIAACAAAVLSLVFLDPRLSVGALALRPALSVTAGVVAAVTFWWASRPARPPQPRPAA